MIMIFELCLTSVSTKDLMREAFVCFACILYTLALSYFPLGKSITQENAGLFEF